MMLSATHPPMAAATQRRHDVMLAALGVVYGDIGTSPLYAFKQSLGDYGAVTPAAVLGILSLIAWSLALIVTVKYVLVIMRADNRGEGGLLALTALTLRTAAPGSQRYYWIMLAGLIGAALFLGDGVITPAISVLSAIEGLNVATPLLQPYVIPIALVLLIALFAAQRWGTAAVGGIFGPVMLVWFAALAVLGIVQIVANPGVLAALNPLYAAQLLASDPVKGFIVLGAVFLAVTGAEALYADMGHFGRDALKQTWLYFVFPALLLNYFGQGALVLARPDVVTNPFYHLAPDWALYPLVVLASAATIIASQAVISGAFSLTRQAMQLGYLPRFEVRHTSHAEIGQVFVPRINAALLIGVLFLILVFRTSDNLGAAYGIAVSGMMAITTVLAFLYMRTIPGWTLAIAVPVFGLFLAVDFGFLAANLLKVLDGGWFPLTIAAMGATLMATWVKGRAIVAARREAGSLPLTTFLAGIRPDHPKRIPGTAVFLTSRTDLVPSALLHSLKHFKVLQERVILMTMHTEDVPRVADAQRIDIQDLDKGFHAVIVHYGFMEEPSVIRALALCRQRGMRVDLMETSFFIGHERLRLAKQSPVPRWRRRVFLFLYNNMLGATEFFGIPPNRAVEVGGHTEI